MPRSARRGRHPLPAEHRARAVRPGVRRSASRLASRWSRAICGWRAGNRDARRAACSSSRAIDGSAGAALAASDRESDARRRALGDGRARARARRCAIPHGRWRRSNDPARVTPMSRLTTIARGRDVARAPESRAAATTRFTDRGRASAGRTRGGRHAASTSAAAPATCGARRSRAVQPRCIGLDAVRYAGLPDDVTFHAGRSRRRRCRSRTASADVTAAVEVIEHLENPRAFVRELVRITRPGRLGRRDDAEPAERAEPVDAGRERAVLGVPGARLSRAPNGAARDRSAAHRGRVRPRGHSRSTTPAGAGCR